MNRLALFFSLLVFFLSFVSVDCVSASFVTFGTFRGFSLFFSFSFSFSFCLFVTWWLLPVQEPRQSPPPCPPPPPSEASCPPLLGGGITATAAGPATSGPGSATNRNRPESSMAGRPAGRPGPVGPIRRPRLPRSYRLQLSPETTKKKREIKQKSSKEEGGKVLVTEGRNRTHQQY